MATPGGGLSTGRVFAAWDEMHPAVRDADMDAIARHLIQHDLAGAQALSFNALEAPAVSMMPKIRELMDAFRALGAPFVRMTGSGSTVFAAFPTMRQARAAADRIPGAIVTRTLTDDET